MLLSERAIFDGGMGVRQQGGIDRAPSCEAAAGTGLVEIASIKARLLSPEVSGPHKVKYAEILDRWIALLRDHYVGPLPDPMTEAELAAYRRSKAAS
jgi:hypothetical protein